MGLGKAWRPWASSCIRWPDEREMGVYVCRFKFGVSAYAFFFASAFRPVWPGCCI